MMGGCWTCRLRRKKCPGNQPGCSTCVLLNVTCYGYGPKPDWMDGGINEKGKLEDIKKSVKKTTESQRKLRALHGLRLSRERKALATGLPEIKDVTSLSASNSSSDMAEAEYQGLKQSNSDFKLEDDLALLPWVADSELESTLLMHFLDVIWPLQFPFFNPHDRGWVLALYMRNKPLYNVALTLAAYNKSLVLSSVGSSSVLFRHDQERFYAMALSGLRDHIGILSQKGHREGLKDSIDVISCVNQLIMFEVARGGYENWQKHLKAAPDLFPFLTTYCTHEINPLEYPPDESSELGSQPAKIVKDGPYLSFTDHQAMELNSGVTIWADILGSASTGERPQYSDICTAALGDNSKLQLKVVMGCENWAMIAIREIAVLTEWKRHFIEKGLFSVKELVIRAHHIEQRLDARLHKMGTESFYSGSTHSEHTRKDVSSDPRNDYVVSKVTQAFARAAKVYLNVLVSGPNPEIPEVAQSVEQTLVALRELPEPRFLRHVVWPFCIAGCMATQGKRQSFRDLASLTGIHREIFGTSWRALEVMETCWSMRDEGLCPNGCNWLDAMTKMGQRILLI